MPDIELTQVYANGLVSIHDGYADLGGVRIKVSVHKYSNGDPDRVFVVNLTNNDEGATFVTKR